MTDFTFYTPENAPAPIKKIFGGIQQTYGFIPNLFAYMAEAPVTVEAYLALNDYVSKTSLTPAQQQTALLTASVENGCGFCTVAHTAIGKMKKANEQSLQAVCSHGQITDPKDRALVNFTQAIIKKRGRLDDSEIQAFLDAGFTKQQIFEVILIVAIKTLSNYSNLLTKPEPNKELLAML